MRRKEAIRYADRLMRLGDRTYFIDGTSTQDRLLLRIGHVAKTAAVGCTYLYTYQYYGRDIY